MGVGGGSHAFSLVIFPDKQTVIEGLSESVFGRVAREIKVEVVEGGLTHKNM